jgi:hypothetical protein
MNVIKNCLTLFVNWQFNYEFYAPYPSPCNSGAVSAQYANPDISIARKEAIAKDQEKAEGKEFCVTSNISEIMKITRKKYKVNLSTLTSFSLAII